MKNIVLLIYMIVSTIAYADRTIKSGPGEGINFLVNTSTTAMTLTSSANIVFPTLGDGQVLSVDSNGTLTATSLVNGDLQVGGALIATSSVQVNGTSITNGTDDPTSVATEGEIGDLYLQTGTGSAFIKRDSGITTNWVDIGIDTTGGGGGGGSTEYSYTDTTTDYTIQSADQVIDVTSTSTNTDITLPTASGVQGKFYYITKSDTSTNYVRLLPDGSETIGNQSELRIRPHGGHIGVVSTGTNWEIISENSYHPESLYAVARWEDVSCTWSYASNVTSYQDYPANSTCGAGFTGYLNALDPGDDRPHVLLENAPRGWYRVMFYSQMGVSGSLGSSFNCRIIYSGTGEEIIETGYRQATEENQLFIHGVFQKTDDLDMLLKIQCYQNGSGRIDIRNDLGASSEDGPTMTIWYQRSNE